MVRGLTYRELTLDTGGTLQVTADGPASHMSEVQTGDFLVAIDGLTTLGMPMHQVHPCVDVLSRRTTQKHLLYQHVGVRRGSLSQGKGGLLDSRLGHHSIPFCLSVPCGM